MSGKVNAISLKSTFTLAQQIGRVNAPTRAAVSSVLEEEVAAFVVATCCRLTRLIALHNRLHQRLRPFGQAAPQAAEICSEVVYGGLRWEIEGGGG
ncbi:hypothetical protein, partial [Cupriavidus necator]